MNRLPCELIRTFLLLLLLNRFTGESIADELPDESSPMRTCGVVHASKETARDNLVIH
jgi:hypothetical protein